MKSKYKIVIIDDDELAVDNLVFELKSYPHFSIEGISQGQDSNITWENGDYSGKHTVALGGVWNMKSEFTVTEEGGWFSEDEGNWNNTECNAPMTITVNCPNGFFFESISNPGARRPFALLLVLKESYSSVADDSSSHTNLKGQKLYLLQEGENVINDITYSYTKPGTEKVEKSRVRGGESVS